MIQVWFYKGKGDWFDKLTRIVSRSKYSHCEIVIDDMAYSADAWTNQVRPKRVALFNKDNWDVLDVTDIYQSQQIQMLNFLKRQIGCSYDWLGLVGLVLGIKLHKPTKWYCSELCAAVLHCADTAVYPGELYTLLTGEKK